MCASVLFLVVVLGSFGEIFDPGFCETFESFSLGKQRGAQAALDTAFTGAASEAGDGGCTAGSPSRISGYSLAVIGPMDVGDSRVYGFGDPI